MRARIRAASQGDDPNVLGSCPARRWRGLSRGLKGLRRSLRPRGISSGLPRCALLDFGGHKVTLAPMHSRTERPWSCRSSRPRGTTTCSYKLPGHCVRASKPTTSRSAPRLQMACSCWTAPAGEQSVAITTLEEALAELRRGPHDYCQDRRRGQRVRHRRSSRRPRTSRPSRDRVAPETAPCATHDLVEIAPSAGLDVVSDAACFASRGAEAIPVRQERPERTFRPPRPAKNALEMRSPPRESVDV